jgi:protein-S-isoprenylcysteine O-methyltransferase Ste14
MNADTPNTLPWPPIIYATVVVVALVCQAVVPVTLAAAVTWPGFALLCGGLALDVWAMWTMYRARTNILPHRAAGTLVTHGPFAWTRNPIYVGNTVAVAGLGMALQNGWLLVAAVAAALFTHKLAVVREEAHLRAKFGSAWDDYASRVRRWGVI